jgi:hypothetical protein
MGEEIGGSNPPRDDGEATNITVNIVKKLKKRKRIRKRNVDGS